MSQISRGSTEYAGKSKQAHRDLLLAETEQVIPWYSLLDQIELFQSTAGRGRYPCSPEPMLRGWPAMSLL